MENSTISEPSGTNNVVTIIGFGVSIVTSFFSFLTAILAITYVVIKSKFQDVQNTDVEIVTKTGNKEAKIKITLLNDETYQIDKKSFDNKKQNNDQDRKSEKIEKEIFIDKKDEALVDVLENNHNGDKIIASTRKDVTIYALNTFLKANQIHAMNVTDPDDGLQVSMLHKSDRKKLNKVDEQKDGEKESKETIDVSNKKDSIVEIEKIEVSPELLGDQNKGETTDV